jgi:hypothetical protein
MIGDAGYQPRAAELTSARALLTPVTSQCGVSDARRSERRTAQMRGQGTARQHRKQVCDHRRIDQRRCDVVHVHAARHRTSGHRSAIVGRRRTAIVRRVGARHFRRVLPLHLERARSRGRQHGDRHGDEQGEYGPHESHFRYRIYRVAAGASSSDDFARNFGSSDGWRITLTLIRPTVYENFPHARSVAHQMILLPPRMTIASTNHP